MTSAIEDALSLEPGRATKEIGYVPMWEVVVNGTKLEEDIMQHVSAIEVAMDVDAADQVKLSASSAVDAQQVDALIDSHIFAEGNSLEVFFGTEIEPLEHMGRYDLQMPTIRGDADGRGVEVVGLSGAAKLLSNKQPRQWPRAVTDDVIVQEIATAHGMTAIADPTKPRRRARTKKSGTSDFELLNSISQTAQNDDGTDFRWYVRWDEFAQRDLLIFESFKVDPQQVSYRFVYQDEGLHSSLMTWEVNPDLKSMPTKVSVVYMDRASQEEREVVANVANPASDPEVLWSGRVGGLKGITSEIKDGGAIRLRTGDLYDELPPAPLSFDDSDEALDWVKRWYRRRQHGFASLKATVIGLQTIRPWDIHTFSGMSDRWDGQYMITSVRHLMSASQVYVCDLVANRLPTQESLARAEVAR